MLVSPGKRPCVLVTVNPAPPGELLHPNPEWATLTCSSNLVITAWTHSTGLWAAMAGRRETAAQRWLIRGARPPPTRLFPHENALRLVRRGAERRVFFLFSWIHHATAMTHHRKSSSEKLVGGVGHCRQADSIQALRSFLLISPYIYFFNKSERLKVYVPT